MSQNFDVAVIGLGTMGSAALAELAERGLKVIGFERHYPAHPLGSSHGDSRMIRLAYFEDPSYVPILQRAYAKWRELEQRSGQEVLSVTGVLQIGLPDSDLLRGVLASCALHGLSHEVLDASSTMARFPAFSLDPDEMAILDPEGGFVRPEIAISLQVKRAAAAGAVMHFGETITHIDPGQGGVTVVSNNGRCFAKKVIVATGAWINQLVPRLQGKAKPIRQVVAWYHPKQALNAQQGRMPGFIRDEGPNGAFFGFPAIGSDGVKIGRHLHFNQPLDPDEPNAPVDDEDFTLLDQFAHHRLPTVASFRHKAITCRYTMMPNENFLIDFLPGTDDIIICSACSGHGFKFASVIGEILADLAEKSTTDLPIGLFAFDRHFPG